MTKSSDVKNTMRAIGGFSDKDLEGITDESLAEMERTAQPVPEGTFPPGAKPLSQIWTGNNLRIANGVWYWQDQPGNQCGRQKSWSYKALILPN